MSAATDVLRMIGIRSIQLPRAADPPAGRARVAEPRPEETGAFEREVDDANETDEALEPGVAFPPDVVSQPGFVDVLAAIELVSAGLAGRVVLSRLRAWPGLLWQAQEAAAGKGVAILPGTADADGRIDIEIARDIRDGG